MAFPRDYGLKRYNGKLFATALLAREPLDSLTARDRTFLLVDSEISLANKIIRDLIASRGKFSELQHIKMTLTKPKGVSGRIDLDMKIGYNSTGTPVFTRATVFQNCSVHLDRSLSGATLGGATYFTEQRVVPTEFDCVQEDEIQLEALIDHNSVEVIFFDWYSSTNLIFTEASNN